MEEKRNVADDIFVLNLNNYVKPVVKEEKNKEWVLNGKNNEFYNYIIERYNGSPTNSAIINGFSEMIYGKGLTTVDPNEKDVLSIFNKKEVRKIVSDFKLFGSASLQVVYSKGRGALRKVVSVHHIPRETIAPAKINEEGDIEFYFYSNDWSKANRNEPEIFPAFGTTKNEDIEIMIIEPYKAGKFYYSDPDYLPALQYANLEEEISNYSINHIRNGLSAGFVINMNNGVPNLEDKRQIEKKIKDKTAGSSAAGNVILQFNDNPENKTTVEAFPTNPSHKQWEFWVKEARTQIMVGHRVISPMLFGIKDSTGLGNNADELATATKLLQATVIAPMQELILDSFMEILSKNGKNVELEFKQLVSFVNEDGTTSTEGDAVELKKDKSVIKDSLIADAIIEQGENFDSLEGYELIFEEKVVEDPDNEEIKLAKTFSSFWNSASEQDNDLFKVRYVYAPNTVSPNSREFCRKMVSANKVYRKEDIVAAGEKVVNEGFGANGSDTYSIWKYKGGVNCKHFWQRRVYLRANNTQISVNEARNIINSADPSERASLKLPINETEVAKRTIDQPNQGRLS